MRAFCNTSNDFHEEKSAFGQFSGLLTETNSKNGGFRVKKKRERKPQMIKAAKPSHGKKVLKKRKLEYFSTLLCGFFGNSGLSVILSDLNNLCEV